MTPEHLVAWLTAYPVLSGWILLMGLLCLSAQALVSVYGAYWLAWTLVGRVSRRVRHGRAEREIDKIRAAWRSGQLPPPSLRVGYGYEFVDESQLPNVVRVEPFDREAVQRRVELMRVREAFEDTDWGTKGAVN